MYLDTRETKYEIYLFQIVPVLIAIQFEFTKES